MSVLKYKDPVTGEVKTVGAPTVDSYTKTEVDAKLGEAASNLSAHATNKSNPHGVTASQIGAAPAYTYGTTELTPGVSALATGKLYIVYE